MTYRRVLLVAFAIAVALGVVFLYIWISRPFAMRVFYDDTGLLQRSNAGENVQGLFAYHSAFIALLTLLVVVGTAVLALVQLFQIRKDRDLESVLRVLQYHDDPTLFKIRFFVHNHFDKVNSVLDELNAKTAKSETDRERLNQTIRESSLDVIENGIKLEDLVRLVNVLNQSSLFIRKFLSEDHKIEFYAVIVQMWKSLKNFVWHERECRKPKRGPMIARTFALHFEALAAEMESAGYKEKVSKWLESNIPKSVSREEYDRLADSTADDLKRASDQIQGLEKRVAALESVVRREGNPAGS